MLFVSVFSSSRSYN